MHVLTYGELRIIQVKDEVSQMKVLALVPAFNEERNIYEVVTSIKACQPEIDVLVVNDGSLDRTSNEAKRAGAHVIDLPNNLGIGGAVQTGYMYAVNNSYDIAIQVDGDGQHDPEDIGKLIESIEKGEADMVIGSRFVCKSDYKPSFSRKMGINFFAKIVSILVKSPIMDTTSGYRAVNKRVIELFANYYPTDYPEVETIVYASRKGMKIKELPVNMRERQGGRSSITPVKAIYYMLKVTLALILQP